MGLTLESFKTKMGKNKPWPTSTFKSFKTKMSGKNKPWPTFIFESFRAKMLG